LESIFLIASRQSAEAVPTSKVGTSLSESATQAEGAWLTRLRSGDEAAFGELLDQYHGRLLRLARSYVSDASIAEEVVQETWLAVLEGLDAFEGRSSFKAWLFRILVNRAMRRGEREGRTKPFSALVDEELSPDPNCEPRPDRFGLIGGWEEPPRRWSDETGDSPENLVLRKEALACLEKGLATLPAAQHAVVTLRDVEGLTSEEACQILQLTEGNQRVLLHRGRSRLRHYLETHLG
jgi:RNA polymerase sigma-70 factor (ECF subfamily)